MGWFSKDKPPHRRSRMEMVQEYLPRAKPFTKALILRGATYQDEAYDDLKKMLGSVKYGEDDNTFEGFVKSCATTVSHEISDCAAKNIERTAVFLPYKEPPPDAHCIVGFGLCALFGIVQRLDEDDVKTEFWPLAGQVTRLYYMFHQEDEILKFGKEGIAVFRQIARADRDNIIQWRENLAKLARIYVTQWDTDDPKIKAIDCKPLLGKMLGSLINAFNKNR